MSEQPYGDFGDWLHAQTGRDDPVGEYARAAFDPDRTDLVDVVREVLEHGTRSDDADAFRAAQREFRAYQWQRKSTEDLFALEGFLYRLLMRLHDETDCGRDGKHWAQCNALVSAFGWESWSHWKTVGTPLEDD